MLRNGVAIAAVALVLAGCSPGGGQIYGTASTYADPPAQKRHARATIQAAEDGKPAQWTTANGSKGAVLPVGQSYSDRAGRPCRPLKQDASVNGERLARDVTACKAADGTWVVTDYQPEKAD